MRDGDLAQFNEFVTLHLTALYRYAYVLTGNPHDAEDLVQEALTRTGVAWRRVRRKDDPEGYVRSAMARIMANRWRRPRRERLMAEPPDRPVEDCGLDRMLSEDSFEAVLAGLPGRMRAVLVLRYAEQLSEEEIAQVLGCSRGTVKSQASRALARLRATVRSKESLNG
ncbi:MAG: SigE family RNA polymerase sigma factor [Streptosporangiales bacterium]|nr:SigE family RNA polymerase sigma factor [Streptosporangiales bacterium]